METVAKSFYAILDGVRSYIGTEPDKRADASILCDSYASAKQLVLDTLIEEAEILENLINEIKKQKQEENDHENHN